MTPNTRREFLADVGRGMFVAGLGSGLAFDMGLSPAWADEKKDRLTFDKLEPLVSLMQETPATKLLPLLVEKLKEGAELRTLVSAGALANARTFGGQDYTGYHAFMALPPALEMSKELPAERKALPVLKVLFRNSDRIQQHGGTKNEILHPIAAEVKAELSGESLQAASRKSDMTGAENEFARMRSAEEAFNALQYAIQDEIDVHRIVLAWRAWTMLDIAGKEHAHTLLRQSVRFCVDREKDLQKRKRPELGIRELLPKLFDEHKLAAKTPGAKKSDDEWIQKMADIFYGSTRDKAAEAAAMALAEGFSVDSIGEAMSLASTMLVLHDPGRKSDEAGKPKGSVHGASVGVHASDSANAWRGVALAVNARNAFASMIVGAYHTAGQSTPPTRADAATPKGIVSDVASAADAARLLDIIESSVRGRDQVTACAAVRQYGNAGHKEGKLFDLLLKYAVSEDGALHAEKYYRTVREEFARTRPAFRWDHLVALARVTASESGFPAPGYADACRLLKLS